MAPIFSKEPEKRRQSREKARTLEVPGYSPPRTWSEVREGPCLQWEERQESFVPATCIQVQPGPGFALVLVGGMTSKVYDLSLLRFSITKEAYEPNQLVADLPELLTPQKQSPLIIMAATIQDSEGQATARRGAAHANVYERIRSIAEASGWSYALEAGTGDV